MLMYGPERMLLTGVLCAAYDKKDLSIRGWQVVSLQANTLGVKYRLNGNNASNQASFQPGVSYTVHVQRRTSAFYTYLLVKPSNVTALSTLQALPAAGPAKQSNSWAFQSLLHRPVDNGKGDPLQGCSFQESL